MTTVTKPDDQKAIILVRNMHDTGLALNLQTTASVPNLPFKLFCRKGLEASKDFSFTVSVILILVN